MRKSILFSLAAALMLGGCSFAPDLEPATPELPQRSQTADFTVDTTWWNAFGDPQLSALIAEALAGSDDLKSALANVTLAKATLGLRSADRFPSIDAAASAYRQRTSEEGVSPMGGMVYNTFDLSVGVGYELDLWGKFKNAESAAWSELVATEADKEALRISLIGSVAELYIDQIALQRRYDLLEQTEGAYRESLDYRERELRHGAVDALTVERERALTANAQVMLASVEEAQQLNANALALMLGRDPKTLMLSRIEAPAALPQPLLIPAGIGSELMQRRPDIKAAEERLRSANASIGVARADYFPSISLTGSLGVQSSDLDNLFKSSARTWGFGPALSVPILDFGRVRSGVDAAEARKELAQIDYARSVKNAFKEVHDALGSIASLKTQSDAQSREVSSLETVLNLATKRFESGYGDYLDVLDAKRSLLSARIAAIDLDAALLKRQVQLYKALGGGWSAPQQ